VEFLYVCVSVISNKSDIALMNWRTWATWLLLMNRTRSARKSGQGPLRTRAASVHRRRRTITAEKTELWNESHTAGGLTVRIWYVFYWAAANGFLIKRLAFSKAGLEPSYMDLFPWLLKPLSFRFFSSLFRPEALQYGTQPFTHRCHLALSFFVS
jgi:hypothetical protein